MLLGAIFGILTAACFSASVIVARRGMLVASADQGIYFSVVAGVPLFLIVALLTGQLFRVNEFGVAALWMLAGAGVSEYLVGRYSNFRAIRILGANASSPLRSLNVVFAVVLAVVLLDESISLQRGLGMGLVILAPLVMLQGGVRQAPAQQSGATPQPDASEEQRPSRRHLEGYFWGLVTAVGYGAGPLLIRASVGGTGLGIAGALLSYIAAALLLLAFLALPGRLSRVRAIDPLAIRWFLAGAVFSFLAHMFRFVALDVAPVTVVAPLQQTAAIFIVVFSFLVNRRFELFGPRVILAIMLSAGGTVALVSDL